MLCWAMLHVMISQGILEKKTFRVTSYSVGHGIAILLEYPNGEKHLYDCGANDGGQKAAKLLLGDFLRRGIHHLDRVYLSHADLDHYSSFPEILSEVEIDEIVTTEQFLSSTEPNIISLISTIKEHECRLRMVQRGDMETVGEDVRIEVMHPAAEESYSSDNAASLVLKVTYADSDLLLTGDVEAEGMSEMLEQPAIPVDLLLAPHHGSVAANNESIADWCSPHVVVVSCGREADMPHLNRIYGDAARVHNTDRDGALLLEIFENGERKWLAWKSQLSVFD